MRCDWITRRGTLNQPGTWNLFGFRSPSFAFVLLRRGRTSKVEAEAETKTKEDKDKGMVTMIEGCSSGSGSGCGSGCSRT